MANFPALKSGAVAQYGSARERRRSTRVFQFLDGSEQRIGQQGGTLRRWTIALELLDEAELEALAAFFDSQGGRGGSFSFVDPWDEVEYPDCSFDQDELVLEFRGEGRGAAVVVIKQVVSG